MQTRAELYDRINYHDFEQKLDALFAALDQLVGGVDGGPLNGADVGAAVAGEAAEHGLAQQPGQQVAGVPAAAAFRQDATGLAVATFAETVAAVFAFEGASLDLGRDQVRDAAHAGEVLDGAHGGALALRNPRR